MTGWDDGGREAYDPWNPLNLPDYWGSMEGALYDQMIGHNDALLHDERLQELYHDSLFNPGLGTDERISAREELDEYMRQNYGLDFWHDFDWEAYREWYG